MEEEGSSGKVSLSEKVVLVLLAIEAAAVKEGSGFLPLRRVLGRAIKACAIKACVPSKRVRDLVIKAGVVAVDSGTCCQKQVRVL